MCELTVSNTKLLSDHKLLLYFHLFSALKFYLPVARNAFVPGFIPCCIKKLAYKCCKCALCSWFSAGIV